MEKLDPILHNQLRLAIMAILASVEKADFQFILNKTGATKGNVSVQLTTLENSNYIAIDKFFEGKKPQTWCQITEEGRKAMETYTEALKSYLNL